MNLKRQISIAGASVLLAMGIVFVMQNSTASAAKTTAEIEPAPLNLTAQELDTQPQIMLPDHAGSDYGSVPSFSAPQRPHLPSLKRPVDRRAGALTVPDCEVAMTGDVQDGGIVDLTIDAPCLAYARATLHHQGMMISLLTDGDGQIQVSVPALSADATFIVAFGSDNGALASFDIPEVSTLQRAVLQWQGDDSFEIHAYENGADFGEEGHVWAQTAPVSRNPDRGFVMALGDVQAENALLAQVYTYPRANDVPVALEAAAEITSINCGREVSAQSLRIAPKMDVAAIDLVMTMPGCDTVGDFLILQNMFRDLKLALK